MPSLVPCTACARHVRASESSCPFCGAELAPVAPREPAPMPADRLLARTAITFAAAAAATAITACGKTDAHGPPNTAPAYGVPVVVVDGSAAPQAPSPDPQAVPAYGAPPIEAQPTAAPEQPKK